MEVFASSFYSLSVSTPAGGCRDVGEEEAREVLRVLMSRKSRVQKKLALLRMCLDKVEPQAREEIREYFEYDAEDDWTDERDPDAGEILAEVRRLCRPSEEDASK